MKNLKKKLALLAALACAGTMLAGCGGGDDTTGGDTAEGGDNAAVDNGGDASETTTMNEEEQAAANEAAAVELADDGDKLTILCWTGDDLNGMIEMFCNENPDYAGKVEWVQQGTAGGEAREQYKQYLSGEGDADLLVLEADWILEYLTDEYTVPLSSLGIDKSAYNDAYPYTVAIGTDEQGILRGATWQAAPGGFVYRTDLAEQYLGVTSPEEMQDKISDWSKFEEAAKTVAEASEGKTAMTATLGGLWQVYQANRTQPWVKDNKLVLDNAEGFIDVAKSYYDNKYVTDGTQWNDGWYALGQDGSTLGYFLSTWGVKDTTASVLANVEGCKDNGASWADNHGLYNICIGPQNYFWGGSWLAVSTKCDNKTIATDFVNFFTTNKDTMQKYAETSGDFVNNKAAMDAIVAAGTNSNSLLGGQDQFAVLAEAANGINMDGLITKYDSAVKSSFNTAVTDYATGVTASKDDALNAFQDDIASKYPELNWD